MKDESFQGTSDIVEITPCLILLFSIPVGVRTIGGYFQSWITIYWLDDLNVSSTILGFINTLVVPVYFFYFLIFGFHTDNRNHDHNKSNSNTSTQPRRKPVLLFTLFGTALTWYLWIFNPNWFNFVDFDANGLAIWFGLSQCIHEIMWRSWSVTNNSIAIELTSIHDPYPNDDYRTILFGIAIALSYIGGGIGDVIPGYLPSNNTQTATEYYFYFILSYSVPYFVFGLLSAFLIREPRTFQINTNGNTITNNQTTRSNQIDNHVDNDNDGGGGARGQQQQQQGSEKSELSSNRIPLLTVKDDVYDYDSVSNMNGLVETNPSLVASIIRCMRNTPFIAIFCIELCTRTYLFSDILIYKYYCNATNEEIATLGLIVYIIRAISSFVWCYISVKWMKNTNHKYTICVGFCIYAIAYILYAFIPYNIENNNSFLQSPIIWIQSILFNIGSTVWDTISPSLLASIIDFDCYLWPTLNRREAIYQGLLKEGIQIDGIWNALGLILLSTLKKQENKIYFQIINTFGAIPICIAIWILLKFPEKKLKNVHDTMSMKRLNRSINRNSDSDIGARLIAANDNAYGRQNSINNTGHGHFYGHNNVTLSQAVSMLDHYSLKQLNILHNSICLSDEMEESKEIGLRHDILKEMVMLIGIMIVSASVCVLVMFYFGTTYLAIVSPVTLIVLFSLIYIWIDWKRWKMIQHVSKLNKEIVQEYIANVKRIAKESQMLKSKQ